MKVQDLFEMAKRTNLNDFYAAAKKKYGAAAVKDIKWSDVVALARELDVTIPAAAHKNKTGRGRVSLVPDDHADKNAPKEEPKKPEAKKEEPKAPAKGDAPTKEELKKMLPDGGDDRYSIDWGVSDYGGKLEVYFTYTFRRDTSLGAYQENKRRIESSNDFLRKLATKYKDYVKGEPRYCTAETAKASDKFKERNGDDAYSEYEQSIGGYIQFKS